MLLPGPDSTTLRSLTAADAGALHAAIAADRDAFDPWLRWSAAIIDADSAVAFIAAAAEREANGRGFHLGMWEGECLLGGVVCWSRDPVHQVAELGYWLVPAARGRGLVHRALRPVIDGLFADGVNRIEFQCRVENAPSRAVAERIGGVLEGTRRQSHFVNGAWRDHAVYSLIAGEWRSVNGKW